MIRTLAALIAATLLVACRAEGPPPATPLRPDVSLSPDTTLVNGLVPRNATLDAMLRGHGVAGDAAQAMIAAAREVFDPRRLRSLQPFSLVRTLDGALRSFEYEIDERTFLRIASPHRGEGPLRAELVPIPRTVEQAVVSGAIDSATPSLFASVDAAGEGAELAFALAAVLSGEIDFNSELQPGDGYTVASTLPS